MRTKEDQKVVFRPTSTKAVCRGWAFCKGAVEKHNPQEGISFPSQQENEGDNRGGGEKI